MTNSPESFVSCWNSQEKKSIPSVPVISAEKKRTFCFVSDNDSFNVVSISAETSSSLSCRRATSHNSSKVRLYIICRANSLPIPELAPVMIMILFIKKVYYGNFDLPSTIKLFQHNRVFFYVTELCLCHTSVQLYVAVLKI